MGCKLKKNYKSEFKRIRGEMAVESQTIFEKIRSQLQSYLEEATPVDTGQMKSGWIIRMNKSGFSAAGRTISAMSGKSNTMSVKITVENKRRGALFQRTGWTQIGYQKLVVMRKPNGRLHVLRAFAPNPMVAPSVGANRDRKPSKKFVVITRPGKHNDPSNPRLGINPKDKSIERRIKKYASQLIRRSRYFTLDGNIIINFKYVKTM
jgi:hypothetical protein